jgi:hypothetical protein
VPSIVTLILAPLLSRAGGSAGSTVAAHRAPVLMSSRGSRRN